MKELFEANSLSGQIQVINTFAGDKSGSMFASQEECGYVQALPVSSERMMSVQMSSIDDFCNETSVIPDLLKIDVEGFEHEVLLGAQNVLRNHMPIIFLEFHLFFLESRGIYPKDTLAILKKSSYKLYDLSGCLKSPEQHINTFQRIIKILALHSDFPLPDFMGKVSHST
jgi:FkbM family methyltransferase